MFRNTKVLACICTAAGILLGYAAASGMLNPFPKAAATPPVGSPAVEKTGCPQTGDTPACCSEGVSKSQLVALADPKVKAAVARVQGQGKKPNIVFIMGDDVGWFNIGAYHQGIMSG